MSEKVNGKPTKKSKGINPYALLFAVIVICGILSYIIPPGAYEREVINGRTVINPTSFHITERTPVEPLEFIKAIPMGLIGSGNVVWLILLVGGTIEVLNRSGALGMGIYGIIKATAGKGDLVIWVFMIFLSILGGFLGWAEVSIPFAPILIPVIISLGYDAMTAGATFIIGILLAFSVGPTNMYTVGVSHDIAELEMFSGFGFRMLVYTIFVLVGILYVTRYAKKVRKNPELSLTKEVDVSDLRIDIDAMGSKQITSPQKTSLLLLLASLILVIFGSLQWKWDLNDITSVFLILGVAVGLINGMGVHGTIGAIIDGIKGSMGGALIVGVARGVQWILETGGSIDPIIHGLSGLISGWPTVASAIGMMLIVTLLNGLVPSGSGKAMALMPLLIPLADLIGLTRQTAVLAYQFGDGITNMFWFTYGTLLMFLNFARVPLKAWYKFFVPLMIILFILSCIFLFVAVQINYV